MFKKSGVLIIAEAGVNHNGSLELAKKLVDIAKDSGSDAVKFQTFVPELVTTTQSLKADYQKRVTDADESQLEMIRKIYLPIEDFAILQRYCEESEILFLSTAFDLLSVDGLNKLDLPIFKIPSGEITHLPYLRKIAKLNKKLIISTGMAKLPEIRDCLDIFVSLGMSLDNITLLHCNTEYPTPFEDANLRAIQTLRKEFGTQVGYSDHTMGIECVVAAVAMGASIVEKHFTIDKSMEGPDHKASLSPEELKQMVVAIRNIEKSLGSGIKTPSPSESKNISIVRRSIVANTSIKKGELFSEKNLICKRPGSGISPMRWDKVLGEKAERDFQKDDLIEVRDLT